MGGTLWLLAETGWVLAGIEEVCEDCSSGLHIANYALLEVSSPRCWRGESQMEFPICLIQGGSPFPVRFQFVFTRLLHVPSLKSCSYSWAELPLLWLPYPEETWFGPVVGLSVLVYSCRLMEHCASHILGLRVVLLVSHSSHLYFYVWQTYIFLVFEIHCELLYELPS